MVAGTAATVGAGGGLAGVTLRSGRGAGGARAKLLAALALIGGVGASGCGGDRGEPTPAAGGAAPEGGAVVRVVDGPDVPVHEVVEAPRLLDPDWTVRFEPEIRFRTQVGAANAEPRIFLPRQVVMLDEARLLVVDEGAEAPLALVDLAADSVVARFGRMGQGPGELSGSVVFLEGEPGAVRLFDLGNSQVHEYGPDGTLLRHWSVPRKAYVSYSHVRPGSDELLSEFVDADTGGGKAFRIHRFDPVADTDQPLMELPWPPDALAGAGFQHGRGLWTVLDDRVVTMRADLPVLRVHDLDGRALREVHLPLSPRELTARDIAAQIREHGDIARKLQPGFIALTNFLYPVSDTVVGMLQGAMWRAAEDPDMDIDARVWRLVSTGGGFVGTLAFPDDFVFLGWSGGYLWGSVPDELGAAIIVGGRVRLPGEHP
ncbi:MAG: hypothetical protein RJQ04_20200 [Longimicrobiales bacterium]